MKLDGKRWVSLKALFLIGVALTVGILVTVFYVLPTHRENNEKFAIVLLSAIASECREETVDCDDSVTANGYVFTGHREDDGTFWVRAEPENRTGIFRTGERSFTVLSQSWDGESYAILWIPGGRAPVNYKTRGVQDFR